MNIHYNNYLVRKYPLLYRNRYASPKTTAMVWGSLAAMVGSISSMP